MPLEHEQPAFCTRPDPRFPAGRCPGRYALRFIGTDTCDLFVYEACDWCKHIAHVQAIRDPSPVTNEENSL